MAFSLKNCYNDDYFTDSQHYHQYIDIKDRHMIYQSTRHNTYTATASLAILNGIAPDGGLYTPLTFPKLPMRLEELPSLSYQAIAFSILKSFLTDFSDTELDHCIKQAYSTEHFDTPLMTPLHSIGTKHYLELFHGKTIAFKDMALSILPYLMQVSARKNNSQKEILILTATSGDTGKAALTGFADVPNTRIIVFYPKGKVSAIQERQMLTQAGENTHVIGITGNFDDAQSAVKDMFTHEELVEQITQLGYQFSSANSINIGRLTPQIAYYVYAYAQLVENGAIQVGECVNIAVPTGNFGNILAAYYAKQMGLPIHKLLCASNKNNVLSDFFNTQTYDKQRPFFVTNSPSMDIVVSSNLERLLFHICGNDADKTQSLMTNLAQQGHYTIDEAMANQLNDFYADFTNEEETLERIQAVYEESGYVIDPHTAVADGVVERYRQKTGDDRPVIIASTASPYKFADSVLTALNHTLADDDFTRADDLEKLAGVAIPKAVTDLKNAPIRHHTVVDVKDMQQAVLKILQND